MILSPARSIFVFLAIVFSAVVIPDFSALAGEQDWAGKSKTCSNLLELIRTGQQVSPYLGQFVVERNLLDYTREFSGAFRKSLLRLKREQVFWDLGAGEAFAAEMYFTHGADIYRLEQKLLKTRWTRESQYSTLQDLMPLFRRPRAQRAQVVAITHRIDRLPPKISGLKILSGRYFEDIPAQELGTFDLAIDFFGVLAYTPRPDLVLQKLLQQMRPGAELYVHAGAFRSAWIRKKSGHPEDLLSWLERKIPSLRIDVVSGDELRFTLMSESVPEIPELRLVEQSGELPPTRVFREVSRRRR